jgi:hypothetical protein
MTTSRPILFSAPMVRAILQGTKTQTRRLASKDIGEAIEFLGGSCDETAPVSTDAFSMEWAESLDDDGRTVRAQWCIWGAEYPEEGCLPIGNGYGNVGDELWVRETWAWPVEEEVIYRADPQAEALVARWRKNPNFPQVKWNPSIFMPRQHSRITLRLTGVRIERLQDIDEAGAKAEGAEPMASPGAPTRHVAAYRNLWGHLHGGDASWLKNPWVWVLTFERVKP